MYLMLVPSSVGAWAPTSNLAYVSLKTTSSGVVLSLPATEETGDIGREIESCQGIGW
jgi:hypothetical protein